jgi:hypothetical protein
MTGDFKFDNTGDLKITGNDIEVANDIEAIAQSLMTRIAMPSGEFRYNSRLGSELQSILSSVKTHGADHKKLEQMITREVQRALHKSQAGSTLNINPVVKIKDDKLFVRFQIIYEGHAAEISGFVFTDEGFEYNYDVEEYRRRN